MWTRAKAPNREQFEPEGLELDSETEEKYQAETMDVGEIDLDRDAEPLEKMSWNDLNLRLALLTERLKRRSRSLQRELGYSEKEPSVIKKSELHRRALA